MGIIWSFIIQDRSLNLIIIRFLAPPLPNQKKPATIVTGFLRLTFAAYSSTPPGIGRRVLSCDSARTCCAAW